QLGHQLRHPGTGVVGQEDHTVAGFPQSHDGFGGPRNGLFRQPDDAVEIENPSHGRTFVAAPATGERQPGSGPRSAPPLVPRRGRHVPDATAAATDAMCNGLASTRPWPMAAEARSTASPGSGKSPPTAPTPAS